MLLSLAADSFTSLRIRADDVIVQHLRIRPGQLAPDSQCFTDWPVHTGQVDPLRQHHGARHHRARQRPHPHLVHARHRPGARPRQAPPPLW